MKMLFLKVTFSLGTAVIMACCGIACFSTSGSPTVHAMNMARSHDERIEHVKVPRVGEIAAVYVELFNTPLNAKDVRQFQLEAKYFPYFSRFFAGYALDDAPTLRFDDTASIKVVQTDGRVIIIAVHSCNADVPLEFSTKGIRLRQSSEAFKDVGGSGEIEYFLRRVYFWQTGHCAVDLPPSVVTQLGLDDFDSFQRRKQRR